jgi:RimJ/RimL family protein N-acetyltransferase
MVEQGMVSFLTITDPIHTERLVIRPFVADDMDGLYDLQSRPEVTRYLYWETRTHDEVAESLALKMGRTTIAQEGDIITLAVALADGGPLIGDLMLGYKSATHHSVEIGYTFNPKYHGHGYATEAAGVLLALAFEHLGAHRVWANLDARNERSALLLERLGLRREAHLVENEWVKGKWTDEVIYAVLAGEWPQTHMGGH